MGTTQAVVLARGLGTRMQAASAAAELEPEQRRAAEVGAKGMMPLGTGNAARPFIEYTLSALADAGVRTAVLVVAPDDARTRAHFAARVMRRLAVTFAVQGEALGTADAVAAARGALADEPFLVVNGDNYYSADALRAAAAIGADGLVAYDAEELVRQSGFEPARVLRYALLDLDGGTLRAIREKPSVDEPLARARERWVSMNLWSFTPRIFDACARVRPSERGELELQDAVTIGMRDLGMVFTAVRVRDAVLDLTLRSDISLVTQRLAGVQVAL